MYLEAFGGGRHLTAPYKFETPDRKYCASDGAPLARSRIIERFMIFSELARRTSVLTLGLGDVGYNGDNGDNGTLSGGRMSNEARPKQPFYIRQTVRN